MNKPLAFIDVETTGLEPDDEVWEFAGRRRNSDGTTNDLHMFIAHDTTKAQRLPAAFYDDWLRRFPDDWKSHKSRFDAATEIQRFLLGAHIVGSVPSFDTEKLAALLRRCGLQPKWSYHLIDVENVVVGFLAGRGELMVPPWSSEMLSHAVGVDPSQFARHTAMGDMLWVEAQWDAVMTPQPVDATCPW